MHVEHWDTVYADRGELGVSWFTETPALSLELLDSAHAGPEQSLIDVGAGASTLVDDLLDRGVTSITLLDLSSEALRIARERLGAAAKHLTPVQQSP